eukprot:4624718-Pyramimonas_sp.AAC.1
MRTRMRRSWGRRGWRRWRWRRRGGVDEEDGANPRPSPQAFAAWCAVPWSTSTVSWRPRASRIGSPSASSST